MVPVPRFARTTPRPFPGTTPPAWAIYLAVFVGGMIGGSTRYLVSLASPAQPGQWPWGIFTVNLTGAFLMGLLLTGWIRRGHVAHPWRPFLATGVLGAFTTWSTVMADTHGLIVTRGALFGATYVLSATALGIAAAAAGWWTAQRVVPSGVGDDQ